MNNQSSSNQGQKTFTMVRVNSQFRIHKAGCRDIVKDVNIVNAHYDIKAENTKGAVKKIKQELYESAGGVGNFEDDKDVDNEPRSFTEQYFVILPCCKNAK